MKFRLSQQNIGHFFRNADISLKFRLGIIPIKEQEVACSFRLNKLILTKKGSWSLGISQKSKLIKLRACYQLSDLPINRTIRFYTFHANLSNLERKRILPLHMFSLHDLIEINATLALLETINFRFYFVHENRVSNLSKCCLRMIRD